MSWVPLELVTKGGPWVLLLALLLLLVYLKVTGVILAAGEVDRAVAGYVETIRNLKEELGYWRTAAEKKDDTIRTQADQLHKMMAYSEVGTHFLEDIVKEARKRGVDA